MQAGLPLGRQGYFLMFESGGALAGSHWEVESTSSSANSRKRRATPCNHPVLV